MARVHDFLRRHMATVNRLVNIDNERLLTNRDWLDRFAPFRSYMDYDLLLLKVKQNRAIAHVVGFEGEIPESRGGEFSTAELTVLKIAKSHVMTENDMKLLRKWQENVNGVPDQVRDYFFGNVTTLVPLVRDTHTLLWVMGMLTGKIQYIDPVTNVRVNTVYTNNLDQYPVDLTAVPDANNEVHWTDSVNALPIRGLRRHYRGFRDIGKPMATLMNEETYDTMVDTAEFRREVAARRNVDASAANSFTVSMADAEEVFRVNGIAPIQIVESTYQEELPNGTLVDKFFFPEGHYAFAWDAMGERAVGPVESNNGQAGIYTFTEEVSKEPPIDRSVGVSTGAPMYYDTRKMAGRKVYAA